MKVLVADDDPSSRELMAEALDALGYDAVTACNGQEALDRVFDTTPDILILDIQMPLIDGHGVARAVRAHFRPGQLPIIALTAHAMQHDREEAYASGFDAYLTKPITLQDLGGHLGRLRQRASSEVTG